MPKGFDPAAIVGVASAVKAPVVMLREYIEIVAPQFAVYTELPSAETTISCGVEPVAIVGVASAVNAPVEVFREYIEILFDDSFTA